MKSWAGVGALDEGERARFARAFHELCDESSEHGRVALEHTAAIAVSGSR